MRPALRDRPRWFRRPGFVLTLLWVAGLCLPASARARTLVPPRVESGVLDLRAWNFARDGTVALDGQWAFFWKRFIDPEKPRRSLDDIPPAYLDVPDVWNGRYAGNERIGGFGYATYRLRIRLPSPPPALAMHFLDAATACRIYADGRRIYRAGRPGTSRKATVPRFQPAVFDLGRTGREVEVVVHVANFYHRHGGLWKRVTLGLPDQLYALRERGIVFNMVLFGSLFLMGGYHLGTYWLRRKDPSPLYFGLACLAISLRTLTIGERYIVQLFENFPFAWLSRMEYLGFYVTVGCFALFMHALFPKETHRTVARGVAVLSGAFSLLVVTTPLAVYSYSTPVFEGITLGALIYGVIVVIRAVAAGRTGTGYILVGFFVLAATAVNDILYAAGLIQTFYTAQFGVLAFILAQAVLLVRRSAQLFDLARDLQVELRTSGEKYRLLVENANEAIFILQDNALKFANPRAENLFGYSAEELTSQPFFACVHEEDRSGLRLRLDRAEARGDQGLAETFRLIKPSGRTNWVQLNAVPTVWDLRPAILGFVSDIRGSRQLEARLHRGRKTAALGTLAAGFARDIHTFMARAIELIQEALSVPARSGDEKSRLEKALEGCAHVRRRAEAVQGLGRGEDRIHSPVRIAATVESALNALKGKMDPSIRIQTQITAGRVVILADAEEIGEMLTRLVTNAAEAIHGEEGTVHVSLKEVSVVDGSLHGAGGLKPGNYVRLTVADNGTGIAEEIQDRVFDPYFTTETTGAGTGMGLAVVAGIVSAHRGEVGLVSAPGRGTTVHVYLPVLPAGSGTDAAG